MTFGPEAVQANREYFLEKLRAQKQRSDVVHAVETDTFDFLLLDTRGREPFTSAHIPGAWCAPLDELEHVVRHLPRDKEVVTYCWGHD
jgi:rhodanese-related sulfurtransferase